MRYTTRPLSGWDGPRTPHPDRRHVFPQSLLSRPKLKEAGITGDLASEYQALRDQLPNLQLLEGPENIAKSDTPPMTWAASVFTTAEALSAYMSRNEIPSLPADVGEFVAFFAERRAALAARIAAMLGTSGGAPNTEEHPPAAAQIPGSIDDELSQAALGE